VPFYGGFTTPAKAGAMASFTIQIQLELGFNSRVHVVDLQPADIPTEFNQGVIKSTNANPRLRHQRSRRTWEVAERNMKKPRHQPDLGSTTCFSD